MAGIVLRNLDGDPKEKLPLRTVTQRRSTHAALGVIVVATLTQPQAEIA